MIMNSRHMPQLMWGRDPSVSKSNWVYCFIHLALALLAFCLKKKKKKEKEKVQLGTCCDSSVSLH